eukprot:TRINITY_DN52366_c0_g1_i1.p1 TRINITY_DN52366_c0_g1~~TRINITY_DN52366_c0_g1_i1.p1  ORF type:complete len:133 (+),score=20.15 TRINITY_DN52366_c0_g1_i1:56-454(+)
MSIVTIVFFFFFQAEDGIRDAQESRGLGDVYKRQTSQEITAPTQLSPTDQEVVSRTLERLSNGDGNAAVLALSRGSDDARRVITTFAELLDQTANLAVELRHLQKEVRFAISPDEAAGEPVCYTVKDNTIIP